MPVPTEQEREDFVRKLEEAEQAADRGEFILFERDGFLERLRADYGRHRTSK